MALPVCQMHPPAQTVVACQVSRRRSVAHNRIPLSILSKFSKFTTMARGRRRARGRAKAKPKPAFPVGFLLNFFCHREFPSLSGAPQAQQNTSAQQMWSSNPSLRTAQHSTIQRPQGQGAQQQGQGVQAGNQQIQNQAHDDGGATTPSQFTTGGDDYRFGGQAGVGQLSGGAQPQTGNIDEFPPLGGSGADVGPDRRTGMIQNAAAYGTNTNATAFPGLGQTRNGLSSPTEGQQDRPLNSGLGGRGIYPNSGMFP